MTLGERLRVAIKVEAGLSIREFHKRMDGRAPGSSYPNIHRYLSDGAEPTLEFLRAAAEVLGVRYQWLAVGQGAPTEAGERDNSAARGVAHAALPADGGWRSTALSIKRAVLGEGSDDFIPYWVAPLADVWILRNLDYAGPADFETLGEVLRGPLAPLGMKPEEMSPGAFNDYVMTMIPVLFGLTARRDSEMSAAHYRIEREEAIRRSVTADTQKEATNG